MSILIEGLILIMELVNKTPFIAERAVLQDKDGKDILIVIVKCTYSFNGDNKLYPAELQVPIQMADDFYGKPGESSIRYESDLVPSKPQTDIVLNGHAYASHKNVQVINVSLKVGPIQKICCVYGLRRWEKTLGFIKISNPEPFEKMQLIYENSFGGMDLSHSEIINHECESRNPFGRGFVTKKSKLNLEEILLPNIEDPYYLIKHLSDRPKPAGFGFIGRNWQPRISYAGTYDEAWLEKRSPMLPIDFDERYFNGAHPDLISKNYLQGGEPVEIINASLKGILRFSLPNKKPIIAMISTIYDWIYLEPHFDTLIIEPDELRVIIVWRASLDVHKILNKIGAIRIAADV